jgi:Asp-tRNA(Asn)/Glu-tRNA(Gln) amidotransferase A subunit family amidase
MNLGAVSGYVSWIGKVAERNASLTEILIESGAVLYVRTNVPQTLMVRFHIRVLFPGVPDSYI